MYIIEYKVGHGFPYHVYKDGKFVDYVLTFWGAKSLIRKVKKKLKKVERYNGKNS